MGLAQRHSIAMTHCITFRSIPPAGYGRTLAPNVHELSEVQDAEAFAVKETLLNRANNLIHL